MELQRKCDLLVVGGGPAGLTAAISAASEGLDVVLIDSGPELGGQAVQSSLIENYPGFPEGISGKDLLGRFIQQATKFHTELRCPTRAIGISKSGDWRIITTDDGERIAGRAVILSPGLTYRRLDAPGIAELMGRGVLYGIPAFDPTTLGECNVCIVGAANSAGQAAMHLSKNATANIRLLARRPIEDQMSDYLVERIHAAPNIGVCTGEINSVEGRERLELVNIKRSDGVVEQLPSQHLFIFIGANPKTEWIRGRIDRDSRNFILTDGDVGDGWDLDRKPFDYETSMPGVFCCGDVRFGSKKRIVSAAAEGGNAVQQVHQYLRLLEND